MKQGANNTQQAAANDAANAARKAVMATLAGADTSMLAAAWEELSLAPGWSFVRAPETGLVMARGRIGGGGAPFNLGEVTVTRCVVALDSGEAGFAYVLGRDRAKAELCALFDALWQHLDHRSFVENELVPRITEKTRARDKQIAERVAATKVDFFTLVRGEDE